MSYTGWELPETEREKLLILFEPAYESVIAHHVTLKMGGDDATILPVETSGQIVGFVDDNAGVQALIVSIGGTTARFDGSTYHITWSIDRTIGRKPYQSNAVIAESGWTALNTPISINLIPKVFK